MKPLLDDTMNLAKHLSFSNSPKFLPAKHSYYTLYGEGEIVLWTTVPQFRSFQSVKLSEQSTNMWHVSLTILGATRSTPGINITSTVFLTVSRKWHSDSVYFRAVRRWAPHMALGRGRTFTWNGFGLEWNIFLVRYSLFSGTETERKLL